MQLTFGNISLELNIFHLGSKHKSGEEQEQESDEDCLIGPGAGKHNAHKLKEELMRNSETIDEESTASVTSPTPLIPPTPPECRMPKTKELGMNATAAHLTASVEELLLLDPPLKSQGCTIGSGFCRTWKPLQIL